MSTSGDYRGMVREIDRLDELSQRDDTNMATLLYINTQLLANIAYMLNDLCEVENVYERRREKSYD